MKLVTKRTDPPETEGGLRAYKSRGERLTQNASTKFTPSEEARFQAFIEYCKRNGIDITTPAAALRYFTVIGLDAFDAELELTGQ
ncbi:MAG: hypothetical protein WBD41_28030 [Rhodococcus sp. (in: high G+C Gram-positive bacteria)]|uniref:hypothetical protein n=1 Tax=Nocardiaceae TaxID=85025 RepID=UPI000522F06B|nr:MULTISPECIES: hypothetical protein [Rhodococcus]OZD18338.1 hypothetical protein CH280_07260 [Rhodococcus sp. 06-156-4C]OZD18936.1 hypothetical protein CH253_17935 [Rhodococcus sp. 06-156-3C]OZD22446.1 hypothetical protein CH248_09520 [Rhodococcus sp. 06-156-4a]OZD34030.1 hypothetical protein CH247_08050 [Rhodococcus sp. 06-156-3b]OZD38767.1 hypothetical protein CH284_06470 [Rhodococcus sp. 06-156-3]